MKTTTKLQLILVLLFLGSCASNIKTKKTTEDNFKEFKTFAYLPNTTFDIKEFNSDIDDSVESSLISSLTNEMKGKGYLENNENPDLLLLLRTRRELNSNENTKSKYEKASSGGSSGSSPNFASTGSSGGKKYISSDESAANNEPYKKGNLVVEVYNRKTKELLWFGVADDFKSHISDPVFMERMLREILKKFPE
ncbi:DUF4136 domain-containing protein [Flagellimonas sp.]|uniref:DUF4136 domain-containing protein n=1 Tax=Flagellimonas sp. TaxID=2058762 RepID=UPI003F49CEEA